jgi:CRP/FNR family transcriptional regulator, dissimilatory nitrate respiration regulator
MKRASECGSSRDADKDPFLLRYVTADRVRHFLAINADPGRRTVSPSGTLKDIAAELGLTHEAFYRTLADMSADGEIERRKGTIHLLKPGV